MTEDNLQSRADALAARVEALAAALSATGVSDETSARLLTQASTAALHALALEAVLEEAQAMVVTEREAPVERRFRLAA